MSKTVAVILAGGEGKRMDALCQDRPKPALPFAGRFRVIDFSLSNCINSRITNIAVLTGQTAPEYTTIHQMQEITVSEL